MGHTGLDVFARILEQEMQVAVAVNSAKDFIVLDRKCLFFSDAEQNIMKAIYKGDQQAAVKAAEEFGLLKFKDGKPTFNLERMELEEKLAILGIDVLAVGTTWGVTGVLKLTGRERPDGSNNRSFPSGHAAIASVSGAVSSSVTSGMRRKWSPND